MEALNQTPTEPDANRARAGAVESTGRSGEHLPDGPMLYKNLFDQRLKSYF